MTTENDLNKIYDELLRRIQHIGIALLGHPRREILILEQYDLTRKDTPSIGEAEDAFMNWNCAILTAFRGSDTLTPEQNLERNIKRNELLKTDLVNCNKEFRSVNGCYREAGMDMPSVEICFFVTNTKQTGDNVRDFFCEVYRLAEKYEQDSFLFTFPGENRVAFLVATNDNGRKDYRDDIKFAGPLFTHVPDWDAWTDCSDGRISFKLKGMIQMGGTGNKKIKIGEGDIFDEEGYNPDEIIVIWDNNHKNSYGENPEKEACKKYHGSVPLVERYFVKDVLTPEDIQAKVWNVLNALLKSKKKRIGFHCSAAIDGSYVKGAKVAFDAVQSWAIRNNKKFESIVIVDIYGDYSKALY